MPPPISTSSSATVNRFAFVVNDSCPRFSAPIALRSWFSGSSIKKSGNLIAGTLPIFLLSAFPHQSALEIQRASILRNPHVRDHRESSATKKVHLPSRVLEANLFGLTLPEAKASSLASNGSAPVRVPY